MEDKCFLIKARTAWTFAHWFEDENCWEDTLKIDGVPPSSALIKETFSNSGVTDCESSQCRRFEEDKGGELHIQSSTDGVQYDNGGATRPSTSYDNGETSQAEKLFSPITPLEKRHVCTVCEKSFGKPSHLVRHLRTHSGDRPFACSQCGKSFSRKDTLQQHLTFHSGVNPYDCPQCSHSFSQKSDLTKHFRIHTGEKPFTCGVCHKSFTSSGNLNVHQRIHSDEKPHKCDHCGRCFTLKSHLKVHMRTHTGETPYSCLTCGKTFARSNQLTRHHHRCASVDAMKEYS